ncbi:MAG TPA: hypothetical protein VMV77_21450 [Bacteroidales bacterium]|nr:hypothetical protein [Bacteroidales bacterium]
MKIDLNNGTFIEIGGALGQYNSLPIDTLIKIAQDLQELVFTLAKIDLPANEAIDLNNFKIELVGFMKGSAVPKFAYTPRAENKTGLFWQVHRNTVNEKFEKLAEISNSGDYGKIIELYPEPIKRNPIVENLYAFVNDFGDAPVNFVEYDDVKEKTTPIYKINRFKPSLKNELISEIIGIAEIETESDEAVGKIKITKKDGKIHRRIMNTYSGNKFSLEYAPVVIVTGTVKYFFKYPLRCLFEKEDNYYIIQSEMLGIIGTGLTEDDAENSFAEEFDFMYHRLNSLEASSLTNHNLLIKNIISMSLR